MLKNGKTKGYRKTGKKVIHRRKTVGKSLPKVMKKDVQKMIKTEIAKNVENKITPNITASNSILSIVVDGTNPVQYNYFVFNPVNSGVLAINQGVDVQSRIGNKIKLKRFIIKGTVYYDPSGTIGPYGNNPYFSQSQGYVDLYFGRPVNTDNFISNQLNGLYQNGSTVITPTAQIMERTYGINKDEYKIYWHKRLKIGVSTGENNNDYKLNHEFGFDVCKACTKNLIVKYNDNSTVPESGLLDSLCLWATFTCPNTDPVAMPLLNVNATAYSPVRMIATSYVEFEDA